MLSIYIATLMSASALKEGLQVGEIVQSHRGRPAEISALVGDVEVETPSWAYAYHD